VYAGFILVPKQLFYLCCREHNLNAMARKEQKKQKGSAGNSRKMGEDFLAKNVQKPDVVETDSGLQYQVLKEGEGKMPDEYSTIVVHQRALLLNGKCIEDTYRVNEPSTVAVAELIEGYKEGVLMMREGSRYRLFVPSELGWGRKGSGSKIPPNALIQFDVQLIEVIG